MGEARGGKKVKLKRIECPIYCKRLILPFKRTMLTYVILRLVSMMFMLVGTATSMAVLLVMLASPSDPESDPETTLRWPFGTFNIDRFSKTDKISFKT